MEREGVFVSVYIQGGHKAQWEEGRGGGGEDRAGAAGAYLQQDCSFH